MIFELVKIFSEVFAAMPAEHPRRRVLGLLDEAIRRDVHFIDGHPTTLFQCLWNTCWWHDCPSSNKYRKAPLPRFSAVGPPWEIPVVFVQQGHALYSLLEDWWRAKEFATPGFIWLRAVRPMPGRLGTGLYAVLRDHTKPVLSVDFSPDGSQIVSGSADTTLRIWDRSTAEVVLRLDGHQDEVTSVRYSPDGLLIASGSNDKTLRLWQPTTGAEQFCLVGHEREVTCVSFAADGLELASGSNDGTVRIWDPQIGKQIDCLRLEPVSIASLTYTPDGEEMLIGGCDGQLYVWNRQTGSVTVAFTAAATDDQTVANVQTATRVQVAAFDSASGPTVAIGTEDNQIALWNANTGSLSWMQSVPTAGHVAGLSISPDATRLASVGGSDHSLRVWSISSATEIARLSGHASFVQDVRFSGDGKWIATASDDQTIRIWECPTEERMEAPQLDAHSAPIQEIAVSQDRQLIATASLDGTVRVWNSTNGLKICRLNVNLPVEHGCFSLNGSKLLTSSVDRVVSVWDVATQEIRNAFRRAAFSTSAVKSLHVSPDGRRVAVIYSDRRLRLWEIEERQEGVPWKEVDEHLTPIEAHSQHVFTVAFSPDGSRMVVGQDDGTIAVFRDEVLETTKTLGDSSTAVTCMAFSSDGRQLAVGLADGSTHVCHTQSWSELPGPTNLGAALSWLGYTPDAKRLIGVTSVKSFAWDFAASAWEDIIEGHTDGAALAAEATEFPLACFPSLYGHVAESRVMTTRGQHVAAWFPRIFQQVAYCGAEVWAASLESDLFLIQAEGHLASGRSVGSINQHAPRSQAASQAARSIAKILLMERCDEDHPSGLLHPLEMSGDVSSENVLDAAIKSHLGDCDRLHASIPLIVCVPERYIDDCRRFVAAQAYFERTLDLLHWQDESEAAVFVRKEGQFEPLSYDEAVSLEGGGGTLRWMFKQSESILSGLWRQGIRWLAIGQLANRGFSVDASLINLLDGDGLCEVVRRNVALQSKLLVFRRDGRNLVIDARRLLSENARALNESAALVGTGSVWLNFARLIEAFGLTPDQLDGAKPPSFTEICARFEQVRLLTQGNTNHYYAGLTLWEVLASLGLNLAPVEVVENRIHLGGE